MFYNTVLISTVSEVKAAESCLTFCDSMDCSPPGASIHGILQARILEQVAISFSKFLLHNIQWLIIFFIALGLCCCAQAFSSGRTQGLLSSCGAWASHCSGFSYCSRSTGFIVAARGLSIFRSQALRYSSVIVSHGRSYSTTRGIFSDQGSNLCPLHWQAYSYALRHQGRPALILNYIF